MVIYSLRVVLHSRIHSQNAGLTCPQHTQNANLILISFCRSVFRMVPSLSGSAKQPEKMFLDLHVSNDEPA